MTGMADPRLTIVDHKVLQWLVDRSRDIRYREGYWFYLEHVVDDTRLSLPAAATALWNLEKLEFPSMQVRVTGGRKQWRWYSNAACTCPGPPIPHGGVHQDQCPLFDAWRARETVSSQQARIAQLEANVTTLERALRHHRDEREDLVKSAFRTEEVLRDQCDVRATLEAHVEADHEALRRVWRLLERWESYPGLMDGISSQLRQAVTGLAG
jgi:hypothetical protein